MSDPHGNLTDGTLVIFDCDGVLVDSERIANELLRDYVARVGVTLSFEETVIAFKGRSKKDCLKVLENQLGHPAPTDYLDDFEATLSARFNTQLRPIAGIHAALSQVKKPYCIASSGSHQKMQQTLKLTGLAPLFENLIFSASEVRRGKPFPDLFLHAAACMGFEPKKCIVVEDSTAGVQAAVASGMRVLGYVDLTSEEDLQKAGAITFKTMQDLPALLHQFRRETL